MHKNSSTVNEMVTQTDNYDSPIITRKKSPSKISTGIQIITEEVRGPDLSPNQRRNTMSKFKDLEHAEKLNKEKNENTTEALR